VFAVFGDFLRGPGQRADCDVQRAGWWAASGYGCVL